MPINIQDFINIIAELCDEKQLKAAVSGSLKGGLLTGAAAGIGALLFGPRGLAIGGAIGGVTAAIAAQDSFKPVAVIIRDMTPIQKRKLRERVENAFRNVGVQDLAALGTLLLADTSLKQLAIREVSNYLASEMNLRIQ